jgi:hypothetical protein
MSPSSSHRYDEGDEENDHEGTDHEGTTVVA